MPIKCLPENEKHNSNDRSVALIV